MKIITNDKITAAVTSGTELSATNYPDGNVLTDLPGQTWIDSDGGAGGKITLTCTLSADSDAFFIYNWLADTVEYSTNGGGAYTSLSTANQNFLSTNRQMLVGADIITKPIFTVVALTAANGLILRFQTTTDRKDTPASGNAIYQFDVDGTNTGRFEDSAGASVNLNNHGHVMIGSHVDIGGTVHKVTKIIGDGTGTGAVTLSGSPIDGTITTIKNPVKVGIVRAGTIETFENPRLGLQKSFSDYSIRRITQNGILSFSNRNHSKIYKGKIVSTVANSDAFLDFAQAYRAKPFACLLAHGMPAGQGEASNFSIFGQFAELPEESFEGAASAVRNIDFRIREVL
jgi:hypothetical protein